MYVFGHRARKLIAQKIHVLAAVGFSLTAPEAFIAGRKAYGCAARAGFDALHIPAHFDNISAEFVAEDRPFMAVELVPVQVRAANAAGIYFDNDSMGSADRIVHSFRPDIFRAVQYCCFHHATSINIQHKPYFKNNCPCQGGY